MINADGSAAGPAPAALPSVVVAPRAVWRQPVGGGHYLHVEDCGDAHGVPVVFLHGGPGAGCQPWQRALFEPHDWRAVFVDQRGAGRSTPLGGLCANTTADLLQDLEVIRRRLGIARWVLAGGSWGATLALLYAQTFPERCRGLLLRGTFLARAQDIAWVYGADGVARERPAAWHAFLAHLPVAERADPVAAFHRRLTGDDAVTAAAAAQAWQAWGAALVGSAAAAAPTPQALAQARIEAHYVRHGCFIEAGRVLRDAPALAGIPGILLHGTHDGVCPLAQAQALHALWPMAELRCLDGVGHVLGEPAMRAAWVQAARDLLQRV